MFALYRLPYSDRYTEVRHPGKPVVVEGYEGLTGKHGFVIAPFALTDDTPMLIIPEEGAMVRTVTIDGEGADRQGGHWLSNEPSETYQRDFEVFHDAILQGRFAKLVLARNKTTELAGKADLTDIFIKVCKAYPRAMVMLFDTPQSGTWLIASPEILVDKQQSYLCTMALAGTMPYDEGLPQWSDKNKHEQRIVECYIEDTIAPVCSQIIKDGPRTVRAGNLMHLRTDFRFRLNEGIDLATLIARLHPTPAVCGLPKMEARDFIREHESIDRRYYSGFAGPLDINGETHLYVSLRCMNIGSDTVTAFAGGGLMPESNVRDEWAETEAKMLSYV